MSAKTQSSYHHGDLKQALVKEALAIIAEEGAAGLSLRELARRVGVTQTAPYRHFEDRDALLATVAEEGFRLLKEHLEDPDSACKSASINEAMRHMGQLYIEFAIKNPSHYRVMFGPFVSKAKSDKKFAGLIQTAEALGGYLVSMIAQGQAAGLFKEGSAEEIADSTWALMHGLAILIIDQHINDDGHGKTTALALELWWASVCIEKP